MPCNSQRPLEAAQTQEELRMQLRELAREISTGLSALEPMQSKELLGAFLSDLVLAVADQNQRVERRQKQAEGIAVARARGVRFGRPSKPLPDNFEEIHQAWRNGQLTLGQAADACGMPESSFYTAAVRRKGAKEREPRQSTS